MGDGSPRAAVGTCTRGAAGGVGDALGIIHLVGRFRGDFSARGHPRGAGRTAPRPLGGTGVLVQTVNGGLFALAL